LRTFGEGKNRVIAFSRRAMVFLAALIVISLYGCNPSEEPQPAEDSIAETVTDNVATRFKFEDHKMAMKVNIVLYAPDEETARAAADAAYAVFDDINAKMSDYDAASEVRQLCDRENCTEFHQVSDELFEVLKRSQELSERTDGAFDVTVGPIVKLWRRARRQMKIPSEERLAEALAVCDYRLIELKSAKETGDRPMVRLGKQDMRIDLGGIAKGYALDKAMEALKEAGIRSALIEAGGDVIVSDGPPDKPNWMILVVGLKPGEMERTLHASNLSIATSGDQIQFVEIDGKRYSHIADPKTGMGLTDHSAVSVIAPDATTADALASAVSVLGPERGIELIDATPGCAARVVRRPADVAESYYSKRWSEYDIRESPFATEEENKSEDEESVE